MRSPRMDLRQAWRDVPDEVWARTQLVYVCSPDNPTGRVTTRDEWALLFELSDRHGFVIAADECYAEIHFDEANPTGRRARGGAGNGTGRLPPPRGLRQLVQAIERARVAFRLRRGRCRIC